jgi:hypothetical protein
MPTDDADEDEMNSVREVRWLSSGKNRIAYGFRVSNKVKFQSIAVEIARHMSVERHVMRNPIHQHFSVFGGMRTPQKRRPC